MPGGLGAADIWLVETKDPATPLQCEEQFLKVKNHKP